MILLINKVLLKLASRWRLSVFRAYTKNKKTKVNIVGKITLINPNIKVGNNVTIYPDVMFWGDGKIEIGDNVDIGKGTVIYASKNGGVKIGNNTAIAGLCYIIDMDHGTRKDILISNQENMVSPIEIGDDCWIGASCKILKGSKMGDGSVLGAGSVLKGTILKNQIAVGVPASVIKERGN